MYDRNKVEKLKDKGYRDSYMESHVRAAIAYQIRAMREQLGLSQERFAELIGTTQSVVSRLENTERGAGTLQTLVDIAHKLDVALIVRFASYPTFLDSVEDISAKALQVDKFTDTDWGALSAVPVQKAVHATMAPEVPAIAAGTQVGISVTVRGPSGGFRWQTLSMAAGRRPYYGRIGIRASTRIMQ